MSSPVIDLMTALVTLLEGLSPPDRASVTYHHLDGVEPESWTVRDRGFLFAPPARAGVAAETGDRATALVEWSVELRYFVARRGRGFFALASAVVDETSQLARSIEAVTSWPAGVAEVFVEPVTPDDTDPDGVVATITLTVLTEDT